MSSSDRFAGRTVIVTGAGSGIGRATALQLAREGARVVATDISGERLADLVAEHPDLDLVTVAGDISTQACVDAVVAAAGDRIDALANVAGVLDRFMMPSDMEDEVWERVLAVNLTAPMRMTRACLPSMIAAGKGAIVNVTSAAGLRATAGGAAYTASKHGLNGFTKSTAIFHKGQGIRCNAVAPGGVITNLETGFNSDQASSILLPIMMASGGADMATPEQIAAAVVFLLSDDASNVNGTVLSCDGGWAAA
jgi:NAD(P)-dependent dehydrogenase (short-subunit alcohol dehydrogenase family)